MPETTDPTVQQLFDLSGRNALVTGASGYLGFAIASALAEAGCRVVVGSRKRETAEETAARLPGPQAGRHVGVALDQMDEASIEQGFSGAMGEVGSIEVLINNGHEAQPADWRTITGEQFSRQLANATGYFLLARMVRDEAVKRGSGASIVMLGSMYGVVGSYPDAYEGVCPASPAAYHALKGGIVHLTRHLAVYWAKDGVRVNCLSPGPFPSSKAAPEMVERLTTRSPMARMGKPHEVKGAAIYLASDASSYVTGQNLLVDGGWTAW
jgi:NAD(P)-dependent dehydrogenase (short-subunit alcohol dehydrogenase family)